MLLVARRSPKPEDIVRSYKNLYLYSYIIPMTDEVIEVAEEVTEEEVSEVE